MINFISHEFNIMQIIDSEDAQTPNYEFFLKDKGPDTGEHISKTKIIRSGKALSDISLFGINCSGQPILINDMSSSAKAIWKFHAFTPVKLHSDMVMDVYQASGSAHAHLSLKIEQGEILVAGWVFDLPTDERDFRHTDTKDYMLEAGKEYTLTIDSKCGALEDAGIIECCINVSIENEKSTENNPELVKPTHFKF